MKENVNFTLKDVSAAMECGKRQGWMQGFLSAKLGIDWAEHYEDDEWKQIIKGLRHIALKQRKEYNKKYELVASSVLFNETFEDYKRTCDESITKGLTINEFFDSLNIESDYKGWESES